MAKGIRINKRNLGVRRKSNKNKHKKKNAAAALLKAQMESGQDVVATKQKFLSKRQKRISKKIQQRKEKAKEAMGVDATNNKKITKPDKKKRPEADESGDEMVVE